MQHAHAFIRQKPILALLAPLFRRDISLATIFAHALRAYDDAYFRRARYVLSSRSRRHGAARYAMRCHATVRMPFLLHAPVPLGRFAISRKHAASTADDIISFLSISSR